MSSWHPEEFYRFVWKVLIVIALLGAAIVTALGLPVLFETFVPSVTPSPQHL